MREGQGGNLDRRGAPRITWPMPTLKEKGVWPGSFVDQNLAPNTYRRVSKEKRRRRCVPERTGGTELASAVHGDLLALLGKLAVARLSDLLLDAHH